MARLTSYDYHMTNTLLLHDCHVTVTLHPVAHIGQIIVEVHAGCTEVASKEGGMGGEDGGDVHLRQLKEEKAHA